MAEAQRTSTVSRALALLRSFLAFERLPPSLTTTRRRPLDIVRWLFEGESLPPPPATAGKSPPATFFAWVLGRERLDDPREAKETRDGSR